MADMIILDTKKFNKAMTWYSVTAPKKLIPAAVRGYINDMAFDIKKKSSPLTMNKAFNYKNSRTKKYIESAVFVKKADKTATVDLIVAEVGVVAGQEHTREFYKREIATRQEKGGKLKQVKSKGMGFRSQLMIPGRGSDPKKSINFRKAGLVRSGKTGNRIQRMKSAIDNARRLKKRYASTPFGIYKVLQKKATRVRTYKSAGTIITKARPWLKPATLISMLKKDRLFQKNLNRQLKKHKLK